MRPFVRPLFIWISGIVWQSVWALEKISFVLLLFPLGVLLMSFFISITYKALPAYGARWIWGVVFACLLLFLSIQMTYYHEHRSRDSSSGPLMEWAGRIQQRLVNTFSELSLSDTEKSVLATITLGHKQSMSREIRQQFSVTGVAHILAVSGFHVAIVCGFLSRILSVLSRNTVGRWFKYLLTLILLWMFVLITGLAVSSVRAGTMLTLYLTGRQLRRQTDGYNTLAASAFCLLVYDPFYFFDIGFQLSYVAVWSILYLQPIIKKRIVVRNPLLSIPWGWVTVTLAAQIGVTFLCLYYFGYFSLVFLLTNLPLTLIATLLIPVALVLTCLPDWSPALDWIRYGVEKLTHSMVWIVDAFSRLPYCSVTFRFSFAMMLLSYASLILLFIYQSGKRPRLLLCSLFLLLIVLLLLLIEKYLHIRI
ncbi:MAG: ComEC/Rec2 family competence protein [Tannerellaceae bacterium]|nr:ComEC/Rec2 family competence protein [Tannerellaceae bacterium]